MRTSLKKLAIATLGITKFDFFFFRPLVVVILSLAMQFHREKKDANSNNVFFCFMVQILESLALAFRLEAKLW